MVPIGPVLSDRAVVIRGLALALTAAVLAFGLAACGDDDDDESGSPDFAVADLEALNFGPNELPEMEYQADVSGPGAFTADQVEEAEEEGDRSGLKVVEALEELGLEADYSSQFFANTRDAEISFVESLTLLFADEAGATEAVDVVSEAAAKNVEPSSAIDPPDLGEQAFGIKGDFDGFLTYAYGWRVGDVIELVTVAPGDQKAGPESTLELAEQLEAKAAGT